MWRMLASTLAVAPAALGQVAVTELLNEPDGTDMGREWVELFNFSRVPIRVAGWTLSDEGTDVVTLPDVTLPSGGYLIVVSGGIGGLDAATARAVFETEWLGGAASPSVLGAAGMALGNAADEIVLCDAGGEVVWSLAYGNDETTGYATFLTETADFSVDVFGSRATPGVVRWGDDNGVPGFSGYEQNLLTRDEWSVPSDISQLETLYGKAFANVMMRSEGSPLLGAHEVVPVGDVNWDGVVGVADLLDLLAGWGRCPAGVPTCPADFDGDGEVGYDDFVVLLAGWG